MTKSQPIHIVVASLIAAVCLAPSALAATAATSGQGEAKNVTPFTAPYQSPAGTQSAMPQGEAKNSVPFTDGYNGDPGLAAAYAKVDALQATAAGEPKNTPPFTEPVGSSGAGFSWIDASIGAAGALGACLLVAAAFILRRRTAGGMHGVRVEPA